MLRQREISAEQLFQLSEEGYVFAIVDACADHELVTEKSQGALGDSKAISLFQNTYMESYSAAAPYLFTVDRDFLDWIRNLDVSRWGVFVLSQEKPEVLVPHLQHFLMVALPNGRKAHFRYYDPRILRAYLRSCKPAELQEFFGPVRGFAITDSEEQKASVFDLSALPTSGVAQSPTHPSGLWPIRPEQMDEFSELSKEYFVKRVVAHLQEFFPDLCELYEKQQLRAFVLSGIQKAATYEIATEREVWAYIDIAFMFGRDFDRDSRYEVLTSVLKDRLRTASDRVDQMWKIAEHLSRGA